MRDSRVQGKVEDASLWKGQELEQLQVLWEFFIPQCCCQGEILTIISLYVIIQSSSKRTCLGYMPTLGGGQAPNMI